MHERTQELEVVSEALARAAAGEGRALLVEGPAGIGKTTLLQAAREAATERGVPVLSARGTELERSHAFGAARRLLGPMLDTLGEAGFAGPAGAARAVLTDDASPRTPAAESSTARLLGLVAVIGIACEARGPLLLAVDDAQWLDEPTLDLLAMIASRLDDLPVLLVAAARAGEGALTPSLARLAADPAVLRVPLAPLGTAGVEAVLRERLGRRPTAELSEAALHATGGNPWFVTALADDLARGSAMIDTPAELGSLAPRAIAETVEARVAAVAVEGPALTEALVVLGDDAEPRQLAELAGVPLEKAVEVLDALVDAGVLARSSPARFTHAIVRASIERRVGEGRRALAHRRAARMLADEGAAPERVAAHLLRSEPAGEGWAVDVLLEAGEVARGRGAPARAAANFERALAEPPERERRPEVLALLGTAELEAGSTQAAAEHLAEALRGDEHPPVDVLRRLAQAHVTSGEVERSVALLEETIDRGGLDDEERAMLTADLAVLSVFHPSVAQRARSRLHVLAAMDGRTPGGRLVLAARARDLLFRGMDRDETVSAAERALARGRLAAESSVWIAWSYAVNSLIIADRGDLALEEIDRVLEDLVARAAVGWYCVARTLRADAQLRAGHVRSALADAAGAVEAASDHGLSTLPAAAANLAAALLEHDQLDEADRVLREHDLYEPLPEHVLFFPPLYTRACVRLASGRPRLRWTTSSRWARASAVGTSRSRVATRGGFPPCAG